MSTRANRRGSKSKDDGKGTDPGQRLVVKIVSCGSCRETLREPDKALKCDFCDRWFCLPCSQLSENVYVLLIEEGMDNLMWFCEGCKHALPGVKNIVKGVKSVQESVKD
jgi:uncharacterized CHY-type Zn-finger protein